MQNHGDLARCITHEMNDDWPTSLEIVAYYGKTRHGKSRRILISADEFFGRGQFNAPMTGDQLINIINRMRLVSFSK